MAEPLILFKLTPKLVFFRSISMTAQRREKQNAGLGLAASPAPIANGGVPPLAGLCTYEEAAKAGYGVDENVRRLKRFNWVETCLTDIVLSQINAIGEWEVKGGLGLGITTDTEHAAWLQARVAELRHPPHHFDIAPDAALAAFCEEALRSEGAVEVLTAIYRVIRPALIAAYEAHLETTNPLADQPTRRRLRFILMDERDQLQWGQAALVALLADSSEAEATAAAWEGHLRAYLNAAGGISGDDTVLESALPPARATAPLEPDFAPHREARIATNIYDFPPHWVYAQRDRPVSERTLALVCKRLLEMDVPEMMASIIWRAREEALAEGKSLPWEYTVDMARQMWDEVRHSMLGEAWLAAHGIDWTRVPLNTGFSESLNGMATAKESHAALYAIEQGLMPANSGKAYEWRVARDSGDPLAQLFMDYDWADEVLHVHIGRHLVKQFPTRKEAETTGNEAFARVMRMREAQSAARPETPDWWRPFVADVLGFEPAPLEAKVKEEAAPWKGTGSG